VLFRERLIDEKIQQDIRLIASENQVRIPDSMAGANICQKEICN